MNASCVGELVGLVSARSRVVGPEPAGKKLMKIGQLMIGQMMIGQMTTAWWAAGLQPLSAFCAGAWGPPGMEAAIKSSV